MSTTSIRSMSRTLFTFGYEGLTIDAFIECLQEAGVQLVMDVRELPLSRKRGFSKTAFRSALELAGIAYLHCSALGCPRPIRDRYKADGDWQAYTRDFLDHLANRRQEVDSLANEAVARRTCLVCFEADFSFCHRTYVARAAHEVGGPPVKHLTARKALADVPDRLAA